MLPICAEIFERIIFNNMIKYFAENNLISPHLPGFRPGDSITQLLSINHEILRSFDMRLEVRGIFLDISKVFDRVWQRSFFFSNCVKMVFMVL